MSVEQVLFFLFSSLALVCSTMVISSRNPVYSVLFLILVFVNASGLLLLLGLDFFAMLFLVVYIGAIAVLFLFVVMMLNIKITELTENTLRYLPIGGLIGFIFIIEVLLVVDQDLIPNLQFNPEIGYSLLQSVAVWAEFYFNSFLSLITFKLGFADIYAQSGQLSYLMGELNSLQASYYQQTYNQPQWVDWVKLVDTVSPIEAVGQLIYTYYFYYFILASLILLVAMIGAIMLTLHKTRSVRRQDPADQNAREFSKTVLKVRTQE